MSIATTFNFIPANFRAIFYGLFFLAVVQLFVWLNLHWDVYFPWMHFELGPIRWVGWLIVMVALILYTWVAVLLCGRGQGPFAEFDPPTKLVTAGPYRYLRNPISACVLLLIFGQALAFSSTGVFMMVIVSMAIAQLQAVALEEPLLEKRFGAAYLDYKAEVPRWCPRFWTAK
jgi:protein-S-isoprenylcysteine O-methyltransferase Ste14